MVSKRLVGAEGSLLQVFGSATVTVDIQDEELQLSVVVIDSLTTEATYLRVRCVDAVHC